MSVLSLILTVFFKFLFKVPRPSAVLDTLFFNVIGKTLCGNSSFPSGHSISIFFVMTIISIAFLPQKKLYRIGWILFLLIIGWCFATTHVGVAKCTTEKLINAYDNTIVYTDFLLASIINDLKQLNNYKSSMVFVSDHGESLGETNL